MKFTAKVIARSCRNEIVGIENLFRLGFDFVKRNQDLPEIKIYVKAAPVDGKANKEVIKILSEALKVPKTRIRIVRGETNNIKTIEVDD